VLEKLPLAALTLADCLVTLRTHAVGEVSMVWSQRIGNAEVSCLTYVAQFFYPVDLAAFYPLPPGGQPMWKISGAIAILAVISAAAVTWRRRSPYFFVGWFWFLGMLSPVVGLVEVANHAMADRYMYLPGIGLSVALTWGGARLVAGSQAGGWAVGTSAGLVIALLIGCSVRQTSFWRDDATLWRHALACTVGNGKAEYSLANALAHKGQLDAAIVYYRQAQQHATDASPYNNLGLVLAQQGKLDEAVAEYRQALAIEPDAAGTHANLGAALARQRRFDEAMEHFRRSLEINPLSANAHCGIARLFLFQDRIDEARAELEQAIQLDPHNAVARNNLGSTFLEQEANDAAIVHFEAALAIDPKYALAHVNLARALAARGQIDEAVTHYRRALDLDPSNPEPRQELDKLLRGDIESPAP
jgi:tetratricopeptide (TPR) repeat protein